MTYLIDTNLLIYPHDPSDTTKQRRAGELLLVLAESGEAALPVQALSEFANVALRKIELPAGIIYEQLHHLTIAFPVLPLTGAVVREAVRGVKDYRFHFYDAQIWAAAKLSGASVVLSEDFPEGAAIEGVKFLNPLAGTFVP